MSTTTTTTTNGKTPPKPSRAKRTPPAPPTDAKQPGGLVIVTAGFDGLAQIVRGLCGLKASAPEQAAFEYWGSTLLVALAEAWRAKCKKTAIALGVIPDYEATPLPIGSVTTVYTSPAMTIVAKVVPQAPRVDLAGLLVDLGRIGIKPSVLKRLVKKHTKEFAGAHIFTAQLTH